MSILPVDFGVWKPTVGKDSSSETILHFYSRVEAFAFPNCKRLFRDFLSVYGKGLSELFCFLVVFVLLIISSVHLRHSERGKWARTNNHQVLPRFDSNAFTALLLTDPNVCWCEGAPLLASCSAAGTERSRFLWDVCHREGIAVTNVRALPPPIHVCTRFVGRASVLMPGHMTISPRCESGYFGTCNVVEYSTRYELVRCIMYVGPNPSPGTWAWIRPARARIGRINMSGPQWLPKKMEERIHGNDGIEIRGNSPLLMDKQFRKNLPLRRIKVDMIIFRLSRIDEARPGFPAL